MSDLSRRQEERLDTYRDAVLKENIVRSEVARLAFQGVPDQRGLRARYWKLLWGTLPLQRSDEEVHLKERRALYKSFCDEFVLDPQRAGEDDHPLALEEDSTWNAYFKDVELMAEIEKDAKRTFPQLHFFNHDPANGTTEHYEALRRLLFIYAKLNPGIRYVQGMNELLAPFYYLCADAVGDRDMAENGAASLADAEADAFFAFTNVMSTRMNVFIKTLDASEVGVQTEMRELNNLLRVKDPALWEDLENKGLSPQFYSFRWLTLLLSQEFELPDVLRLWDSLFADEQRFSYLHTFCCAMISVVRDDIFVSDFATTLKMLQRYPSIDPYLVHQRAVELMSPDYVAPPPPARPDDDSDDEYERLEQRRRAGPVTHASYAPAPPARRSPEPKKEGFLARLFTGGKAGSASKH